MSTDLSPEKVRRLEQENVRLRRAVEELSILNEIATAISSSLSIDQIIELIVNKCVKHLKVEQAAVMLLEQQQQDQMFKTMVRRTDRSGSNILPFRLDAELTGWMLKHERPLLINDFQQDERFSRLVGEDFPIRSLMSVPLLAKQKMIGIITVFNKKSEEGFSVEEQRLLTIIATQSAQVIENARLLVEEQALSIMREEMRMANEIQLNLLPKKAPQSPGYDIAGITIPAKEVGGDYYDFIDIDEHRLVVCVADITGKGLPAAMLMSNVQATIRSQSLLLPAPNTCMQNANSLMFRSTGTGKFVTMFYGILDTESHRLSYCNAGHDAPMLVDRDQKMTQLDVGGVVLGFVPHYNYKEASIELPAGSRLLLYSDGITEALNGDAEEFGDAALQKLLLEHRSLSSQELLEKIVAAVKVHAGATPQSDDMTIVVITRN